MFKINLFSIAILAIFSVNAQASNNLVHDDLRPKSVSFEIKPNVENNHLINPINNLVDYGKFSSFSEMVEDIGQKELEKLFPSKQSDDWEAISRIGEQSDKKDVRVDVYKYINEHPSLLYKEKHLLFSFAETLQLLMYLKKNELVKIKAISLINANLLSETMCVVKEASNADERKKIFASLKKVETMTLNTKERREHYKAFEEITKYVADLDKEFMPNVFFAAYELCFERKPSKEDLEGIFKVIKDLHQSEK